jgi:hypothetical protein
MIRRLEQKDARKQGKWKYEKSKGTVVTFKWLQLAQLNITHPYFSVTVGKGPACSSLSGKEIRHLKGEERQ